MEPRAAMKGTTLLIKRSSNAVNLRQNPRKINDLAIICGASRSARSTWNNANFLWGGTVGSPHLRHPSVQLARSMGHPTARRHSRPSATGPAAPAGTPPSHHQAQQTRTPCSLAGEFEPTARRPAARHATKPLHATTAARQRRWGRPRPRLPATSPVCQLPNSPTGY